MPIKSDPYSYRPAPRQEERIWGIIKGTNGAVTRAAIYSLALDSLIALLDVNPGTIAGYDPALDPSVTQKETE